MNKTILLPTLEKGEFAKRFLELHKQLFSSTEPDFYDVTEHVFKPPAPYHAADHQFFWDGDKWHLYYCTGDLRNLERWRDLLNAGKLDEAGAITPESGAGHAVGPSLSELEFHENLLFPSQGEFDKVSRGVPFVFRFEDRWGMLIEVRGEGGDYQSLAWSDDLFDWEQDPDNPAFGVPSWSGDVGAAQDTCVVRQSDGLYLIYFKAKCADGYVAVGLNSTRDFKTFEEHGPVLRATPILRGTIGLESPCVVHRDGLWHLFYTLGPGTWHAVSDSPTDFVQKGTYWTVGTGSYFLGYFHACEVFEQGGEWYMSTTRKEQARYENRLKGELRYRGTYEDDRILEEGLYLSRIRWEGDQPVLVKP